MLQRLFTVESAQALLPTVQRKLDEVVRARRQLGEVLREVHAMHREVHARGGADPSLRSRLEGSLVRLGAFDAEIQQRVAELEGLGVVLKDLDVGLVDFPTVIGGRAAYLCYMLGEEQVSHWHPVEEGFAGRRPLPLETSP